MRLKQRPCRGDLPEPRPPLTVTVKKAFRITGLTQTQVSLLHPPGLARIFWYHWSMSRSRVVQRYCGGVNYPMCSIFTVGPSELDFEFIKTGFAKFPWRSWVLYGGLVASVMLHAVEGAQIIQASRSASRNVRMCSRTRRIVAGVVLVPILAGLWTVSREPLMVFASSAERYEATFTQSWIYRF